MKTNKSRWRQKLLNPFPAIGMTRISIPHVSVVTTARIVIGLASVGTAVEMTTPSIPTIGVREIHGAAGLLRALRQTATAHRELIAQPQRDWFLAHKAAIVAEHGGFYVAISGHQVVDRDVNLSRLVKRFFGERSAVDVYFGYAGEQEPAVGLPFYFG